MVPTSEGLCFYLKTVPETKNWVQVAARGGDLREQEEAAERRPRGHGVLCCWGLWSSLVKGPPQSSA